MRTITPPFGGVRNYVRYGAGYGAFMVQLSTSNPVLAAAAGRVISHCPCAIGVAQHLNGRRRLSTEATLAAHLAFEPLECAAAAADGGPGGMMLESGFAAVEADVFVGFAVIAGLAVLAFVHGGKAAAQ